MPADGVIQVAVDRYLLPASITRQSIVVTDANGQPFTADDAPIITYDPVALTVTANPPRPDWLKEGLSYKVRFTIPPNDDVNDQGFRAIDRATLDPNQQLEYAFFVGPKTGNANGEPKLNFCSDVLPIFAAKCSETVACHGSQSQSPEHAAGLALDSSRGVANTAINRVANGANTSGRGGDPDAPGRVFGVNMAVIKPFEPDNSWLMYKVELARPTTIDAGTLPTIVCAPPQGQPAFPPRQGRYVPLAAAYTTADDIDRTVLSDYVLGREMPYPNKPQETTAFETPLTFAEREAIRIWIAQGAVVTDCGGCGAKE